MQLEILTDAQSRSCFADLDRAWAAEPTFALVPARTSVSADWLAQSMARLPQAWQRGHFALLTSGSTGLPKLVVGSRERAHALAAVLDRVQLGSEAAATVLALPLTYCYAFVNQWLWARALGRALIPTDGFADLELLAQTLRAVERAMLCLVGAQVPLLRRFLADAVFPGVVRLHFAGGAFPQEQLEFLRGLFPNARIFNNYGCAEAMPRLAARAAEESPEAANIGRPLPDVELRTADDGRLLFRSPYAAVGYVDADGVHEIVPEQWVETGDLGVQAADGTWVLAGRANEVFKRYGEKVSLVQILAQVRTVWDGEVAAYRERDRGGEDGAVLVLAPQADEDALQAVLRTLRAGFARPHWPLRIETLETLPRLPSGKTDVLSLAAAGARVLWRQRI